MLIQINVTTNAGGGKTAVSRLIEQALRDAGFRVTNADRDAPFQTDLQAAVKSLREDARVEIITTSAPRSWLELK